MLGSKPIKRLSPRKRKLRRVSKFIAKRLPQDLGITANDIYRALVPGLKGPHHIDPLWDVPLTKPSRGGTLLYKEGPYEWPLVKYIWMIFYPKIPRNSKFEYVPGLMSCNPLTARPPSYIDIGFETRVKCDQIFMTYTGKSVVEPICSDFQILEDDFELIEED